MTHLTEDLLERPAFLVAGSPENLAAKEEGRALLASRPAPPRRVRKFASLEPKTYGPAKKYACTDPTFFILRSLGWPVKLIEKMTVKKANQIADAGEYHTPAGELEVKGS